MSIAVRREPEVARLDVTTGRVPARDLDPLREGLLRDVGRPGVKQPPEIVVPLPPGQFALELAPGRVGLERGDLRFSTARGSLSAEQIVRFATNRERLATLLDASANTGENRVSALQFPPRQETLPLSFAQERLWFLEQLGLVGSAYNVPCALQLHGKLDVGAL